MSLRSNRTVTKTEAKQIVTKTREELVSKMGMAVSEAKTKEKREEREEHTRQL